MNDETTGQSGLFSDAYDEPLAAIFTQSRASSDGGAVWVRADERYLGRLDPPAALSDVRAPGRVTHTQRDLFAQRIFAIACGHSDGNDADALAGDAIHRVLLDRDPFTGRRSSGRVMSDENDDSINDAKTLGLRCAWCGKILREPVGYQDPAHALAWTHGLCFDCQRRFERDALLPYKG